MAFKNTHKKYGPPAQFLHWLIGFGIIGMLALGFYMAGLERSPGKFELYGLHKSVGIVILALVILRVIWRFMNVSPAPLPHHKRWEVLLAKSVQGVLYLGMVILPLSGWVMSSAGGHPVRLFNMVTMPALVEKNKMVGEWASEIHEVTAYIMIVAIALHIAGALKHHVIDKDETLFRMLPWK